MTTIFDEAIRDSKRLNDGPDWTFELLDVYLAEIDRVAKLYRLDTYPHQIEVITSDQMMDAYSSVGMPINYSHWPFCKYVLTGTCSQAAPAGSAGLTADVVHAKAQAPHSLRQAKAKTINDLRTG